MITINLNDITETNNAPIIFDQTFYVDENSIDATVIGTVLALDGDGDGITFIIESGNTNSALALSIDGGLTVNIGSEINFEITSSYSLVVSASDGNGGLQGTAAHSQGERKQGQQRTERERHEG